MNIFSRFFGSRSKLNFVETQVIEAVAFAVPADAAAILRNQVSLINKVQRLDRDREIDFYHIVKGKPIFPDSALFPNRAEEFELAKVHVTDIATGHQAKAFVKIVKGHLFCIEFTHTPRDLSGSSGLKIEIERLGDPMTADAKPGMK
jgi:hypothetical protein